MKRLAIVLALAFAFSAGAGAVAQQQTGEIFGKAVDASGGVLPGVTVTLSSPVLLQPQIAVTSESGSYQFPRIPIGLYSVRFELPGFKTLLKEQIRIEIGFSAQVNAELGVSTVQETITVTGDSPVVDTRETGTGAAFSQELLQSIPTARDPWVILEQTPGITMDRANVGGSQSGQQSGYISRGSGTGNNKWTMDGVDITDQAATGASPIYFDFDSFEEMQISTGGNDASQQTGGVGINIVTKSGTDKFRGTGRYFVTDDKFEADNVSAELKAQGAGGGAPIQNIKDFGFEGGGPIWKGRAWGWGSYGKQDIKVGVLGFYLNNPTCRPTPPTETKALRSCLATDLTALKSYNIKGQAMAFKNNKVTWHSNFADKIRNARDGSDTRPVETTFRQVGPVWTHKFSDQHIFTDRFMMDVQIAHVGGGFILDFNQPEYESVQPSFEITSPAGLWGRSFQRSGPFGRPADSVDVNANYFLPSKMGGDHAFKTGFRYRDTPSHSESHFGGNTVARFTAGVATNADVYRDSVTDYSLTTHSFFAQDTFTRGRATLALGFRVDRQNDSALPSSVPAHPFVADLLPAISFQGADSAVVWTDFSPRIGLTYDLSGTGKTILKGNYATYYGQMGPGQVAGIINPVTQVQLRVPWTDLNGDKFVTRNELTLTNPTVIAGNYNAAAPSSPTTINSVDPNLKNDRTREFIVGLDREIGRNFGVGFNYIWRKYDQFTWNDRVGITSADYSARTVDGDTLITGGCPLGCPVVTYYLPNFGVPQQQIRTNVPDQYRNFNGIELTARRRYANRFMLNGSFAYNDAKDYWDSPNAYEDPTNIDKLSGAQFAPESAGSGIGNVFTNAKWLVKASGMYTLPWWEIALAANFNARQGYPYPKAVNIATRNPVNGVGSGAGAANVLLDPLGDTRLNTFQTIDFRVEKIFTFMTTRRVSASMDVFNLANQDTILARDRQQNSSRQDLPRGIVAPRVIRFGVNVRF